MKISAKDFRLLEETMSTSRSARRSSIPCTNRRSTVKTGDKPQTETIATLRIDLITESRRSGARSSCRSQGHQTTPHGLQAAMECEDTHLREVCRSAPLFSAYLTPR